MFNYSSCVNLLCKMTVVYVALQIFRSAQFHFQSFKDMSK